MTRTLMLVLGLATTSSAAFAAGFEARTMRDSLSTREVDRGLVLGKGWLEFGLGADVKTANGAWSPEGEKIDWEDTSFLYTTERLALRYGITRRGELYWTVKSHYVRLQDESMGTDTSQLVMGDPHFGYKFEAFRSMAPVTSIIGYFDYKAPAGNEAPGSYAPGTNNFRSFVVTTGTEDITLGIKAKRQIGPVAITGGYGYMRRTSGLAQWAIETDNSQFSSRVKPGDISRFDASVLLQAGPAALSAGAVVDVRDEFRYGSTSPGWFPGKNLEPLEGTDGWALDGQLGLTLNVTRGVDLVAAANIPLRGEDLQFWPIEDIHPTRGNTYSGTFEFRY